jgi:nicotinate (nicotinamide) nucleotide adenylyltransferase
VELLRRAPGTPARLAVLPGTFNPPTTAHLGLARAALAEAGEVLFVLPRALPHKNWEGAGFDDRLRMLEAAAGPEPRFSIGASTRGLFIEIARECREIYGPHVRLSFLCGRDAAERIVGWNYGAEGAIERMLEEFDLLVAPRGGAYHPPPALGPRVRPLTWSPALEAVSATAVRGRIARGEPWEHLVPEAVVPLARRAYSRP